MQSLFERASTPEDDPLLRLVASARAHRAVQHPYLKALGAGAVPDLPWALRDFAQHYRGYSAAFPQYLTAVISRLEQSAHRALLLENLAEESGRYTADTLAELATLGIEAEWIAGVRHPTLFLRFCDAVGVKDEPEHIEVTCWREQLLGVLANASPAEAVGALGLGTETIVGAIYTPIVQAVRRLGLAPRDTVFFELHTVVDDDHQAALLSIARALATTRAGLIDLAKGMHKALAMRAAFWSWLEERARDPERHR